MWFAGIDWADTHHDVVVVDEQGRRAGQLRVPHSRVGLEQLCAFLLQMAQCAGTAAAAPDPEAIACIVETSQGLLIAALLEARFPVSPVNPKTVDRRRNAAGAKTDALDAYLLARTGRSDLADRRRLAPDSSLVAELKALTRDQDALLQDQTRLVNQLTACLNADFPVALQVFGKLHQAATLAFLEAYPPLASAQAASVEELTAFLHQQPHSPGPAAAAQRIWQTLHQPPLVADPITVRTKMRRMLVLLVLVGQLRLLLANIAAYDHEIDRLFREHPDRALFLSLPGAGKRLAPRLLAELGDDRARFADVNGLQALAGTAPVAYQRGN